MLGAQVVCVSAGREVTVLGNSFFDPDGQFVELNEVKAGSV